MGLGGRLGANAARFAGKCIVMWCNCLVDVSGLGFGFGIGFGQLKMTRGCVVVAGFIFDIE